MRFSVLLLLAGIVVMSSLAHANPTFFKKNLKKDDCGTKPVNPKPEDCKLEDHKPKHPNPDNCKPEHQPTPDKLKDVKPEKCDDKKPVVKKSDDCKLDKK